MYNVRYHIASLVGVFLALALGLILGGLVVQRGVIDEQQGSLVAGLQKEFGSLRDQNTELRADNDRLTTFAGDLEQQWAAAKLDGRTILIVARSGKEAGVDDATKAIESAGGKVALAVLLKDDLGLEDAAVRSTVSSASSADEARESLAASLAAEWFDARSPRALTSSLSKAGVLRLEGLEPGVGAGGLVDVAAMRGEADPFGVALVATFTRLAPAVGAQTRNAGNGVAAAAHRAGASALDTLDTPVGRYTLISLLNGAKRGYYGLAGQASALYPPLSGE